jgi:hypothetical protein
MQKEVKNITMIIGALEIKVLMFVLPIFLTLQCKSQTMVCENLEVFDTITRKCCINSYFVDKEPVFLGKNHSIIQYIADKYYDSQNIGYMFSVKLRFVIDTDGKLIGARIIGKGKSQYSKEEKHIINILESSPKWSPGEDSNKKVNVLVSMRYSFVIQENGKLR